MTTSTQDLGEWVSRLEGGYEHLATKADIADVKSELKADIAELRGAMNTRFAELENRIMLRMAGLIVAGSAAVVTLLKLLE